MKRSRKDKKKDQESEDEYDFNDGWIASDDDYEPKPPKKKRKLNSLYEDLNLYDKKIPNKYKKDIERIGKAMKDREITMEKVLELKLDDDDNIWFFEHIKMLDYMDENSEDAYKLKTKICEKFEQVSNIEYKKLRDIKNVGAYGNITNKILSSSHSDQVKALLYKKYSIALENASSDEYFKIIEWIDHVLRLPVDVKTKFSDVAIETRLQKFWTSINNRVYGLISVKEKLLETLCAMLLNKKSFGKIITLVGAPGVGKTSIVMALADAMDLPFNQISLSSINDASVLVGHSSTYIGSKPGVFIELLKKNERCDFLVLLDEIDKIPMNEEGKNISSKLLNILDPIQNRRFNDSYMPEIDADLSNIIFIATANDSDHIPSALKDRLNIIDIGGYTIDDKVKIAMNHIIPRTIETLKFPEKFVSFNENILRYLVEKLTATPGVRNLEKAIQQLMERLALITNIDKTDIDLSYKIAKINPKKTLIITKSHIDNLIDTK